MPALHALSRMRSRFDDGEMLEFYLGVAAVARRLGVAPATLRTWDRRYGLGPARHAPGAHRRYSAADVARLEVMQQALLRGAAPAEAARYALAAAPQADQLASARPPGAARPAPAGPPRPVQATRSAGPPEAGTGVRPVRIGGRALPLAGAGIQAHGLARAAVALDANSVRQVLDESLASQGVIATWDLVVRPVLGAIAQCWERTGAGVEIEHLLSDGALGAFREAQRSAPPPSSLRPVLLTCAPDELHSLPLYPLSAALAGRGVRCRVLGAALPPQALTAAVRRVAPSVVFLWAQMADYAVPGLLAELPRIRPRFRVVAGGPGWSGKPLPVSTELVETLTAATDCIAAAVGAGTSHRLDGHRK